MAPTSSYHQMCARRDGLGNGGTFCTPTHRRTGVDDSISGKSTNEFFLCSNYLWNDADGGGRRSCRSCPDGQMGLTMWYAIPAQLDPRRLSCVTENGSTCSGRVATVTEFLFRGRIARSKSTLPQLYLHAFFVCSSNRIEQSPHANCGIVSVQVYNALSSACIHYSPAFVYYVLACRNPTPFALFPFHSSHSRASVRRTLCSFPQLTLFTNV